MTLTKNWNRFFLAASILIIALFYLLNIYTPLLADDYKYSLEINSINDIFVSQYEHYFILGGRSIAHFTAQFWLLVGKPFFNVANTIVYCLFILLVQFHITGNAKKPNPGLFFTLNIFFWFFVPVWGQNFLWLTGSCNYLWTTTIILFFLVPFRKKQDDPKYKLNLPLSVLFFPLGILAGWCNENSGAAVLFLILAYFILKIKKRNRFCFFEVVGFIGFLIGFIILIAAPGNYVRTELAGQMGQRFMDLSFVLMFLMRFISVTFVFVKNYGFLLLAVSIILGFDIIYRQKRTLNIFSYFYALAVLAATYSMILAPAFSPRAFLIVTVFAVITLGNVLLQMELHIPKIINKYIVLITATIMVTLSFSFIDVFISSLRVYIKWYNRVEYIISEKEKGNLDIETQPIFTTDRHVGMYDLSDINDNKGYWTNLVIAEYFGLKSINVTNEGSLVESSWQNRQKIIRQLFTPPWKMINELRNE